MRNQWLMIKQVDEPLRDWQVLISRYGKLKVGWIKTIRLALAMSAQQLGQRLNVSRGRIVQLENAETHDAVINGEPRFSWGKQKLEDQNSTRLQYINALKLADKNNDSALAKFVRS